MVFMPQVSVIIPNFNHARFLKARVESVLTQTFADTEILILDDASTDESSRVISEFETEPRVSVYFNETNSGSPFSQWNRGISMTTGEYVWIAESDDWAEERFLERMVAVLDANPKVSLAYSLSKIVDQQGRELESFFDWDVSPGPSTDRWRRDFTEDGRTECVRVLGFHNTIHNASAVLFRRSAASEAGKVREDLRYCGDWEFWVRMLRLGRVAFVSEMLNQNRRHEATVSHDSSGSEIELIERAVVLMKILRSCEPTAAESRSLLGHFARLLVRRVRQGRVQLSGFLPRSPVAQLALRYPSLIGHLAKCFVR